MFTLFGIVLLVAGAILTFAIDRQIDGVDLQLVGWMLMAGGGSSLFIGTIRAVGSASIAPHRARPTPPQDVAHRVHDADPDDTGPDDAGPDDTDPDDTDHDDADPDVDPSDDPAPHDVRPAQERRAA